MSNKSLVKSAVIIMGLTIISKSLGFGREALVAAKFGVSFSSDIYVFTVGITAILFSSIGASVGTTFIPMLTEYIETKTIKERKYFINNILNITIFISIILCAFGIIFGKYIILFFAPGFVTEYKYSEFLEAIKLTRIMFVALLFIGVKSVLSGVLQSHKKFAIPAAMAIFSNIIVMIYLIFFATTYGVKGLIVSVIVGHFLEVLIHIPKYRNLGYGYKFVLNLKDNSIKRISVLIIPVIIGTSISQINLLIDRMLATTVGVGAMATMNFANKLNLFIYTVFSLAISTVIYSNLSTLYAKEDYEGYKKTLIKAINAINLIMIPATVGMIILRIPIVNLIFKRGAFNDEAAIRTASVMLFYSFGIAAYGLRDLLNRAFYSIKDTKTPMINSAIGIFINITINFILVKHMGINGLALATSISAITTTILLIYSLNKKLNLDIRKIYTSFTKILFSSIIMGFMVFIIYNFLIKSIGANSQGQLMGVIISSILGGVVYYITVYFLGIEEVDYIIDIVKRKIAKG